MDKIPNFAEKKSNPSIMLSSTVLLALSILPVVLLMVFIYRQDKYQKEPIKSLAKAFIGGMLAIPLDVLIVSTINQIWTSDTVFYTAFWEAGIPEELSKFIIFMVLIWWDRNFDEYMDGIVYASFIGLGFACVENIMYVFDGDSYGASMATAATRAILSVPGHFLFAVMMGYYLGLAKFATNRRKRYLLYALLVPIFFHGTFDALLMVPDGMEEGGMKWMVTSVLFIVFILFDIKMWKRGVRRIRHLQQLSADQNSEQLRNVFEGFKWNF